jgi:hypothetical protein
MTNQSRFDALANLPFEKNRPTAATAQTLKDELIFQRATQTYLWAMPLIYDTPVQGFARTVPPMLRSAVKP